MLWITQGLLAGLFLLSGALKSTRPEPWLVRHGNTGVEGLPGPLIRYIGLSEIAGALALVLPWLTGIAPVLTPVAAACLGLIMPPAAVIHAHRREPRNVAINAMVFAACAFVACGRFPDVVRLI